jgi:hypothetical protein
MATTLTAGPDKVQCSSDLQQTRAGLSPIDDNQDFTYGGSTLASGTGAGQADRRYVAQLTVPAGGSTTLNLSSLLDSLGNAIAFLRIKRIYVELTTNTNAASILVGGGTNPFVNWLVGTGAQVRVRNGMALFLGTCKDSTGYVVTPTTGDSFKITNEDGALAAVVNVGLVGCSA